jgi:hypothetical protein
MGGGFNAGPGGGFNEHLDENALQQAMGQKALSQQSSSQQSALQSGQGGGKAQTDFSKLQSGDMPPGMEGLAGNQAATQAPKPREVGSLKDELLVRPVQDVIQGLKSLFDVNALLGINPQVDSPEEQAKKRAIHQRWNKLDQEQQQVAQAEYQKRVQEKQAEEQRRMQEEQEKEAARANTIQAPASPQKGPKGPGGSKKKRAQTKLQNDRKKLGGPSGSN